MTCNCSHAVTLFKQENNDVIRETPGEFGKVSHLKVIGRYTFLLFSLSLIHLLTPYFLYNRNYEAGELIIIIIIIIIIKLN